MRTVVKLCLQGNLRQTVQHRMHADLHSKKLLATDHLEALIASVSTSLLPPRTLALQTFLTADA